MDTNTLLIELENFRRLPSETPELDSFAKKEAQSLNLSEYSLAHDVLHALLGKKKNMFDRYDLIYFIAFGTTGGFTAAANYVRFLFKTGFVQKLGYANYYKFLFLSIPSGAKIFIKCLFMKKKWPLTDNWHYLHIPIKDIKKEYNIL